MAELLAVCNNCLNSVTEKGRLYSSSFLEEKSEHLEDDESSFEVAVFKGPAEPLGSFLFLTF